MCVFNTWQTTVANKVQKPKIMPEKTPLNHLNETKLDDNLRGFNQWYDVKISIVRDYASI
jgi:hypothetical protein